MSLNATNFVVKGPIKSADLKQFVDLFTGVMIDQPVTFKNATTIGGSQGSSTAPLKLFGVAGQTGNLIELYPTSGSANPTFGFGALGNFAWGPGSPAANDTFLSRIAMQNGHVADTAGLLVTPYLEVAGNISATGYAFTNQATITGPGANPFLLVINQDLTVNRDATITRYTYIGNVNGRLRSVPGTGALVDTVMMESLDNQALVTGKAYGALGANVTTDGTNWLRMDVAQPSILLDIGIASLNIYGAVAAANPITWPLPVMTIPLGGPVEMIASRVRGSAFMAAGEGLELSYDGPSPGTNTGGYIQSFSRATSTYRNLSIGAHTLTLSMDAGQPVSVVGGALTTVGMRATGSLTLGTGAGLEILYSGAQGSILSYDRGGTTYTDLQIVARNMSLQCTAGGILTMPTACVTTANIQIGAAQQSAGQFAGQPTFTTTTTSAWVNITTSTANINTLGNLLRIEYNVGFLHTANNAAWQLAIGFDSAVSSAVAYGFAPVGGQPHDQSGVLYAQLPAGAHTVSFFVNNLTPGTLTLYTGVLTTIYVTEQKR